MIDSKKIKAIAFDFGGTLDSPFMHWMDIYIRLYTEELHLNLTAERFRDSYIYAEQMMERMQLVQPFHTLLETQLFKTNLQFENLIERGILPDTPENRKQLPATAARLVTDFSTHYVELSKPVLAKLAQHYPLLLVSNYYGNLDKVVTDLGIASWFISLTDSTLEGVRKPDSTLWKLAFDRQGYAPEEVLVVGDSMKNDILPALSLGCQAIQGVPASKGFFEEAAGEVHCISSLTELPVALF